MKLRKKTLSVEAKFIWNLDLIEKQHLRGFPYQSLIFKYSTVLYSRLSRGFQNLTRLWSRFSLWISLEKKYFRKNFFWNFKNITPRSREANVWEDKRISRFQIFSPWKKKWNKFFENLKKFFLKWEMILVAIFSIGSSVFRRTS